VNESPAYSGWVDPACPLDWSHPLSQGLVANWSILPNGGWRGGLTLRDLVRGGHTPHDGTLTNGPTWVGGGRPGGYGGLTYNGTSQYVSLPVAVAVGSAGTVAAWARVDNSAASDRIVLGFGGTGGNNGFRCGIRFTSNKLMVQDRGASNVVTSGTALTAGAWAHCVYVSDGAAWSLYLNGVAQSLTLDTGSNTGKWFGSVSQPTGSVFLTVGAAQRFGAFESYWPGTIDSVGVWGRALTAAEVRALYDETRRGNPEWWKWLGRRAWFVSQQATGNRRRRVIIGAGG
jgi:hypothetical protein